MIRLWAIRTPQRHLLKDTIATSKEECWYLALSNNSFGLKNFPKKYWKQWGASQKAAFAKGYSIVEVKLVRVYR
jgi:hypothetical protein